MRPDKSPYGYGVRPSILRFTPAGAALSHHAPSIENRRIEGLTPVFRLISLCAITLPRADGYVLSRGFDLNLSIGAIVTFVCGVVTKQVLRAQLGGNGGECLRQRT